MNIENLVWYLNAAVYSIFLFFRACKLQIMTYADYFTESVLGVWEETLKSVVREGFTNTTRFANGCFAWLGAIFVSKEQEGVRTSDTRTQAWKEWWQQERPSTLNAFIANSTPDSKKKKQSVPQRPPQSPRRHGTPWHSRMAQRARTTAVRMKNGVWGVSKNKGGREMRRTGSDLFDRPSGYAIEASNTGLIEDVRMGLEMGVTKMINFFRICVRWLFRLPPKPPGHGMEERPTLTRRNTAPLPAEGEDWEEALTKAAASGRRHSRGGGAPHKKLTPAGDAILAAGYPLQAHTVVTSDGYILDMERIPREGARDVVFFMHGILDTSMGWVANGTGSHAFSAYDQGMDVWLASSRSNPPRLHKDPKRPRSAYWNYTVNEMGIEDCIAQVDYIHTIKCQELHVSAGPTPRGISRPVSAAVDTLTVSRPRRSLSDSELSAGICVVSATATGTDLRSEDASVPEPSEGNMRREASAPPAPSLAAPAASGGRRVRSTASQPNGRKSADATCTKPEHGHGMRTRSKGLSLAGQQSLHEHRKTGPEADDVSAGDLEASPSPMGGSEGDSEAEEGGDTFEEHSGSPSPSLHVRMMELERRAEASKARGGGVAQLSPDRVSHDGVEIHLPSSTPASREKAASAERRHHEAHQAGDGEGLRDPYRLRAVGHSLGGAALLIYIVTQRLAKKPHHIYRLILLTPAGFLHHRPPKVAWPVMYLLPTWRLFAKVFRRGHAMTIPTSMLRFLVFKFFGDLRAIPAAGTLLWFFMRSGLNGDVSQWDRAMVMPHYSSKSMPAISVITGLHLKQWVFNRRFALYDHGKEGNMRAYGQEEPLDVAANYRVIDCPVDLVAGTKDGIISSRNVMEHYQWMKKAGCSVTYKEFDFGHLDFTFALKEELVYYVRSRIRLRH